MGDLRKIAEVLEFRGAGGDIGLVNATTTTTETTMTDETPRAHCNTCNTVKPETAFPTLSAVRTGYEGARDWNECRACKAARREARKSPDFLHAEIEAFLTVARNAGFGVKVENMGAVVFVTVSRFDGDVTNALELFNSQDRMYVSFRRLTGGIVHGTRYGYKRDERVRTVREAFNVLRSWSI